MRLFSEYLANGDNGIRTKQPVPCRRRIMGTHCPCSNAYWECSGPQHAGSINRYLQPAEPQTGGSILHLWGTHPPRVVYSIPVLSLICVRAPQCTMLLRLFKRYCVVANKTLGDLKFFEHHVGVWLPLSAPCASHILWSVQLIGRQTYPSNSSRKTFPGWISTILAAGLTTKQISCYWNPWQSVVRLMLCLRFLQRSYPSWAYKRAKPNGLNVQQTNSNQPPIA